MTAKILERVRALLAHGETPNISREEADSYLTKAQEMMSKYEIDQMAVSGKRDDKVITMIIHIPNPFGNERWHGTALVGKVYSCRTIGLRPTSDRLKDMPYEERHKKGRYALVIGYESDIEQFSIMSNSLNIQLMSEMAKVKVKGNGPGFRSAFILGFYEAVVGILKAAKEQSQRASREETGKTFLPVLREREKDVADVMRAEFPKLSRRSLSVSNGAGHYAGHAAGSRADTLRPRIAGTRALGR